MLTQAMVSAPSIVPYPTAARRALQPFARPGGLFAFGGKEKAFRPNEELFSEGEPAEHMYKLVKGIVRSYKSLGDGRRKIEAFRLRGDVFGLETGAKREFCAEAIDHVAVLIARRRTVIDAGIDRESVEDLWATTARELRRVQQHSLLLAKNAKQRVAYFFIEMSKRLGEPEFMELPMSRQDIADYLGLTVETVSRTITQFEARDLIRLPTARQIVLRDPRALQRMSE